MAKYKTRKHRGKINITAKHAKMVPTRMAKKNPPPCGEGFLPKGN
jgi:hypothetical protein